MAYILNTHVMHALLDICATTVQTNTRLGVVSVRSAHHSGRQAEVHEGPAGGAQPAEEGGADSNA